VLALVLAGTFFNRRTGAQNKLHPDPVYFSKLYSRHRVRSR
jgi:hypothetical protein